MLIRGFEPLLVAPSLAGNTLDLTQNLAVECSPPAQARRQGPVIELALPQA
jgi:hypothetical protein